MIHLLVTAHIGGDLAYLPPLFAVLAQSRRSLNTRPFLIDTGLAWSAESWVCAATGNRAPYIVLDAMAYHVAFADGLDAPKRDALQMQMMTRLVIEQAQITENEQVLKLKRDASLPAPVFQDQVLILNLPPKGIIQHLIVSLEAHQIVHNYSIEVPSNTLPDPTIAATVEFVVREARYYIKKREERG